MNKKINSYRVSNAESRKNAMNLALICALNKSSRSGFGWVFLDCYGALLSSGGLVIGDSNNTSVLVALIEEYTFEIHDIVLTGDPVAAMLDLSKLIPAIEESSCEVITIGYSNEHVSNKQWRNWQHANRRIINRMPINQISNRLHTGPIKLQLSGRPWVTSISSGTLGHHPLNLTSLCYEFGFKAHINVMLKQSKTVMYTASEKDILTVMKDIGLGVDEIHFVEVDTIADLNKALHSAADEGHTCVLLFCDIAFLKQSIYHDLCDEIVHHIGFTAQETNQNAINAPSVPFENWAILSCETIGQCIRLTLEKDYQTADKCPPLGARLN